MPTLSEADSKRLLAAHGIEFPAQRQAESPAEAVGAAREIGHPVVLKLGGSAISHKTERGLVRLSLDDDAEVARAAEELLDAARPDDGEVHLLIAPMLAGSRELIAGLHRDPSFGMTVMLGVGGVLAEALGDVSFRLVPIDAQDAREMIDDLATQDLLGEVRGEPALDRDALAEVLLGLSAVSIAEPSIVGADLNPLILVGGKPLAADALVELSG